jgi:hypothetical protein
MKIDTFSANIEPCTPKLILIYLFIYIGLLSLSIMQAIQFVEIIAILTVVTSAIVGFGYLTATAQTNGGNATQGGSSNMTSGTNMTSGNTTMQANQAGNISGCDRCF